MSELAKRRRDAGRQGVWSLYYRAICFAPANVRDHRHGAYTVARGSTKLRKTVGGGRSLVRLLARSSVRPTKAFFALYLDNLNEMQNRKERRQTIVINFLSSHKVKLFFFPPKRRAFQHVVLVGATWQQSRLSKIPHRVCPCPR